LVAQNKTTETILTKKDPGDLSKQVVEVAALLAHGCSVHLWKTIDGKSTIWQESGKLPKAEKITIEKEFSAQNPPRNVSQWARPLKMNGEVLGVLEVSGITSLSEKVRDSLDKFARIAETALNHAGQQRAVQEISAILEATKLLNSTLDLSELLKIVLQLATRLSGADRGTVFLLDRKLNEIWSLVGIGLEEHEIRISVESGIAGWVALHGHPVRLEDAYADPRFDPNQRSLEGLGKVVDEAAATVARLQDLARRRRDRPAESVDLTGVLLGAVEMARTALDGTGAALRIDDDVPPLPMVRGTAAELSHLFADLLANARESTPQGGTVEVRARAARGCVLVSIADHGAGIPEENLSRVFDPFFSTSETRETGLVLSIAFGLMQRLGGGITAANRPGGGSAYTLSFPLASARPRREQQKAQRPLKASILLVDDESDNLEVLEELLEMEGHRVETAASGKAAVERFQRGERYDLVLCDVGMPQMSGWQVVRELRRIAPSARIWLLTGWANEISEHDPRLGDVQGVLGKPLDMDQLRSLLGDPQGPTPNEHHAMA